MYTSFDLEVPKKQWMINTAIVGQAQGDIRRTLQKLEGFTGLKASQLLEVATKVLSIKIRRLSRRPTGR
jgi:hypothetical protein